MCEYCSKMKEIYEISKIAVIYVSWYFTSIGFNKRNITIIANNGK